MSSGIEKGRDWGHPSRVPGDAVRCGSDVDAAAARGPVVLAGGDVHRGLGRPVPKSPGEESVLVEVDRMLCSITTRTGERRIHAFAHVVVGRLLAPGVFEACVNAGFVGGRNLTPRSHPGDGVFEAIRLDPSMGLRQRREARRRSLTGAHVPHPLVQILPTTQWSCERTGRERLRIDGAVIPGWVSVEVVVEPGAVHVHL